jgi:D-glycero-D-manno-heptose 1,7-bisphosphate phosphatase
MALLILDRDGVINEDSDDYIRSLADWRPLTGSMEAIAALSRAGYTIAIATNQSGLSRGYFSLDALEAIHAQLRAQVEELGGHIAGIFYCPHLPEEGCTCRKPATGLLQAMEAELGESAMGAIFVGDSLKDLQAARAAGCLPVLVRTGKGEATLAALQSGTTELDDPLNIPVYADLAAAARAILLETPALKGDR